MGYINYKKLIISLALPFAAGAVGAFYTSGSVGDWYTLIEKPAFTPPGWIFAPVWTLLYILMGIAVYRVWMKGTRIPGVISSLIVFDLHLGLNAFWSILFFHFHLIGIALIDILVLLLLIIILIKKFERIDRTSAILLIPYLLWVTFATILNASIFVLN